MHLQNSTLDPVLVKLDNPKKQKYLKPGETLYVSGGFSRFNPSLEEQVADRIITVLTDPPRGVTPLGIGIAGVVICDGAKIPQKTVDSLRAEGFEDIFTVHVIHKLGDLDESLKKHTTKVPGVFPLFVTADGVNSKEEFENTVLEYVWKNSEYRHEYYTLVYSGEVLEPGTGFVLSKKLSQGLNKLMFVSSSGDSRTMGIMKGIRVGETTPHERVSYPHPRPPKEAKSRWVPKTISVVFPSRGRPKTLQDRLIEWVARCSDKSRVSFRVSIDKDDPEFDEYVKSLKELSDKIGIVSSDGQGMNAAVYTAVKDTTEDVVVVAGDDIIPPERWDTKIRKRLLNEPRRALITWDGSTPVNCETPSLYVASRGLIEDWGYILWPEYNRAWSENDYFERLILENRCVWALDLKFEHRSYRFVQERLDEVTERLYSYENYERGLDIYNRRRARGFQEPLPF